MTTEIPGRFSLCTCLSTLLVTWVAGSNLLADDWTHFRGSDNTGIASETAQPPVQWNAEQIAWQTEIPGVGWSSPVYKDNLIWLTSAITQKATAEQIEKKRQGVEYAQIKTVAAAVEFRVIAVDLDSGQIKHDLTMAKVEDPDLINPMNSYASPTCAISDNRVVCHFGSYGTWCLDATTGETIWHEKFIVDHSVGPGSSPLIDGGQVILVCDGIDKQFVVSVELATGEVIWQTNRPPMRATSGEHQKAYCTPLIIEVEGQRQAVIPGSQWIVAYDPETGKEIWRADHGGGYSVTPMASYESGLIIFSTGYTRPEFVAVEPTGTGDVTSSHIKWRVRNAPTMPSFIATDGKIFAISDKGILNCLDAETGEVLQRKRIGGNFSASPLLAAGNLFLSSREGVVTVVRCSESMEDIARNQFESPILASPAVVGNDLIVRTEQKLYRIKK